MKIPSATITGLAGHIVANKEGTRLETNPVYVATPIIVPKSDYQKPVKFEFNRQQSMVRVGLYETIPGYTITNIKFYDADGTTATSSNIILTSATPNYFVGGSKVTGTVTYDWTTATPSYTYAYNETDLTKSKNWYAGKLEHGVHAKISSEPTVDILYGTDKDMSTTGYFTVLPTPSATPVSAILIKCDYTLSADDFQVRQSRLQALLLLSLQHIASGSLIHAIHTSSRFLIRLMVLQVILITLRIQQVSTLSHSML